MTNSMSNAGRLLDDDDLPSPRAVSHRGWARTNESAAVTPRELPRLAAPEAPAYAPPLRPAQRACYEALSLALQEGHVFAAVTGPAASGKTMVLDSVLADRQNRSLRCIRISDPDRVPARLAAQIEEVAYAEAGKPENLERHVVLAVDDAHTASDDLLKCLARLAAMREPGRRVPQVLLVGRPELWHRLASEELSPLARRIAIRAVLPPLEDEVDPWASLEQEVSQTMSDIRAESALSAQSAYGEAMFGRGYAPNYPAETAHGGLPLSDKPVPPPMEYALFPDPPARRSRSERRESKLRLILPISCLAIGVAVFGFVLSYYDWPDVFGEMPWSKPRSDNSASFVFPAQGSSHGLPRLPGWSQAAPKHTVAGAPNPYAPSPTIPNPIVPDSPLSSPAEKPGTAVASATPASEPTPRSTVPRLSAPVATVTAANAPTPNSPAATVASVTAALPGSPVATLAERPRRDALAEPQARPPVSPTQVPATAPALAAIAIPVPPAETRPVVAIPTIAPAPRPLAGPAAPVAIPATPSFPTSGAVRLAALPLPVVALLLRRGEEQFSIGDIFAARLFFERAAEAGSAQGALRLGRTYDPALLPPANAQALGDSAAAKRWYARAIALGDKEAAGRLKAINEGR